MTLNLFNRIDERTRLAGHNRLALLLFYLGGRQLFGVNVFKVQEVLRRPPLFSLPATPARVLGAADIRGRSIPVLDLGNAIGHPEADASNANYLVVTEFNRSAQGFLVSAVDRIVNISVEDVKPPPNHNSESSYLTATTRYQGDLIQILDVEKVLAEIKGSNMDILPSLMERRVLVQTRVLVVDDSRVARNQIQGVLDQLGLDSVMLPDGLQALEHLRKLAEQGISPGEHYALVISDIEMPSMDGYTLTTEIRRDPRLASLYVVLHTSLSGIFNNAMVQQVGADCFVPKYSPNELAERVLARVESLQPVAH